MTLLVPLVLLLLLLSLWCNGDCGDGNALHLDAAVMGARKRVVVLAVCGC
jgi:hypothetical protein